MSESDEIFNPEHYTALLDKLVERGWIEGSARRASGEFSFVWTAKGRELAWHLKTASEDLGLAAQSFDSIVAFCELYALPPRKGAE